MKRFDRVGSAALFAFVFATALHVQNAQAANPSDLYARAKRAIASGTVVPERDLAPLVAVLRGPSSEEDLRSAIDKIETLADASGSSPAEVKHYLLEQSTPLLLNIAATGPSVFARGDAVTALRDMGASRAVLERAATIAEHDRDDYVRSRGEILRNFMKSMPVADAAADVKSGGPREQLAVAALKKRKDDNGNNILMSAAQMCGPRIVAALIAAGADIKLTNGSGMTPLGMALLMHHPDSAEVLVSKGARLNASQAQMLNASVTDTRSKAIIQRAAGK